MGDVSASMEGGDRARWVSPLKNNPRYSDRLIVHLSLMQPLVKKDLTTLSIIAYSKPPLQSRQRGSVTCGFFCKRLAV